MTKQDPGIEPQTYEQGLKFGEFYCSLSHVSLGLAVHHANYMGFRKQFRDGFHAAIIKHFKTKCPTEPQNSRSTQ